MPLREVSGNVLRPQPDVQSRRPGIENQQDTLATRKRPGPKIKAFEARPYKQNKPVRRIERSYPKRRKIDVLLFLTHYRVKEAPSDSLDEFTRQGEDHLLQNCYQRPLAKELKENCRGRGLPVTGVKMVLIECLEKDDRRLKEVARLTQTAEDPILVEQETPTIMQEEGDDFAELSQASDTIDEFTRQAEDYQPQITIGGFSLWTEDGSCSEDSSDSENGSDSEDGDDGDDGED
jgi:hypothetical protein